MPASSMAQPPAPLIYGWVGSVGFTDESARRRGFQTVLGFGETTTLFPMMPGAGSLKIKIIADAHDFRIIAGQAIVEAC